MPEYQQKGIGRDSDKQGLLFTLQEAISDFDQETTRHNEETSAPMDQVMIDESQIQEQETNSENNMNQQNQQNGCVPLPSGIHMILKTIQKYLKNTVISLLIASGLLNIDLLYIYGFITNSGCEDPTIRAWAEISEYCYYMLHICLPFLIKLRLDRLSE